MEAAFFLNMQVCNETAYGLRLIARQLGVKHGNTYSFSLNLNGKEASVFLGEDNNFSLTTSQNSWYHFPDLTRGNQDVHMITNNERTILGKDITNLKLIDLFSPLIR